MADTLTEKLGVVLDELREVMTQRKDRIEMLRREIDEIEQQNAELEKQVNSLLSSF